MGYYPQESLETTINTMGTLLGVRPIVLETVQQIIRVTSSKSQRANTPLAELLAKRFP